MKKNLFIFLTAICLITVMLGSCQKQSEPIPDGSYDFIIYQSDNNNDDLSDNIVVARYKIEYVNAATVTDTLIAKDGKYYFSNDASDYLVLEDSAYGLSYTRGYFANYDECLNQTEIDVSWSYIAVNGKAATSGIGEISLEGLTEFGFVINGWK